jgi:divalent metal cation (Fe/Co/Zn/Cd) transporter
MHPVPVAQQGRRTTESRKRPGGRETARVETGPADLEARRLKQRALHLEWGTNAWNAMEVLVTVTLGVRAGSLALIAFGLDSLVEVFASTVVIVHLRDDRPDAGDARTHRALRLISAAFFMLSAYLVFASVRSLVLANRPSGSPVGVAYLAVTASVMFGLAVLKRDTARAMGSEPLGREAAMTFLDGCLAVGILTALVLTTAAGWWWADAVAALGIGCYAAREGVASWRQGAPHDIAG